MKIIIEFTEMEDDVLKTKTMMFQRREWTIDPTIRVSQRIVWLMNVVQNIASEFKKRHEDAAQKTASQNS